jgi:outer membrane protein TolC
MDRRFVLPALVAMAALAGCALESPPKPDEIRAQSLQNVAVPPAYAAKGGAPGVVGDGWLATFADPQLDALVREALTYNVDLAVAAARVEQAAAYAKLAGSAIYPAVNLLAHGGGKGGGAVYTTPQPSSRSRGAAACANPNRRIADEETARAGGIAGAFAACLGGQPDRRDEDQPRHRRRRA